MTSHDPAPGSLRELLAHYPTGVVAVTAMSGTGPVGLAAGSFLSISLRPPLVGFAVAHTSTTWPQIAVQPGFAISVLAADQHQASKTLATPGPGKFRHLGWEPSPGGSPVIAGAVAYMDCTLHAQHTAGDHDLIVAAVQHFAHLRDSPPLVFYQRQYWPPTALHNAAV